MEYDSYNKYELQLNSASREIDMKLLQSPEVFDAGWQENFVATPLMHRIMAMVVITDEPHEIRTSY